MKNKAQFLLSQRPLLFVVIAVAIFYAGFTAVALVKHNADPFWFVWIGDRFQTHDPAGNIGYDGQFVYYIAEDGLAAADRLDIPAYRLQRILYPVAARALSLGRQELFPWSMLLINFLAIVGSVYVLGRWLTSQCLSPWYALTYGLYVGTFMAYSRDLTEPLAYGLAIGGVAAWMGKKRPLALILLALSILTKEQTMLFAVGIGAGELANKRFKTAVLAGMSILPLLIWETVLYGRFQAIPFAAGSSPDILPFIGVLSQLTLEPGRFSGFLFAALPAIGFLGLSIYWLARKQWETTVWLLLLHAVFVILLPADVYNHIMHVGRNAGGLVIAAIFTFPLMRDWLRTGTLIYWTAPTAVWLLPVLRFAPWTQ